jgi:hypothetical protein
MFQPEVDTNDAEKAAVYFRGVSEARIGGRRNRGGLGSCEANKWCQIMLVRSVQSLDVGTSYLTRSLQVCGAPGEARSSKLRHQYIRC